MGIFDALKNKSGKTQRTHTNLGQKYVTETRKSKSGSLKTTTRPKKTSSRSR